MTPEVKTFVDAYLIKPKPVITIKQFIKEHNHEIWRTCFDCFHHFDLRKELEIDRCPKCKSKNIK